MDNNFWIELLKLGIFSIFITAVLEVFKATFLKVNVVWVKRLNFVFALVACYAFDYGVMARVIQTGTELRASFAGWIDYIGTASLIYMGAGWAFDKFATLKAQYEKKRNGG